ncbi:hypothetical protein NM680_13295 [Paracoccus sp. PS-1]|uniref:hypothetical protein n=1 Tax=Paracoccus sp. PS1 TaxID=2963938 RepID=UPI0027E59A9C|nr:hypothetical protein [Paracoccus sp. PS1]MDQ7262768.1 hypothetical protein [Paracoccus sp. PS1]
MRRYEPKPWDIRRCDMVIADEGEYVLYGDARAEIERLNNALTEAVNQISDLSARLGQAEGRLDASELVGVVEGWKARADKAEDEVERLRGVLRKRTEEADRADERADKAEAERDEALALVEAAYAYGWQDGNHPDAVTMPADAKDALEAYGREKVRVGMGKAADLFPVGSRDGASIRDTILAAMEKDADQ